jgi:hypothetical protein
LKELSLTLSAQTSTPRLRASNFSPQQTQGVCCFVLVTNLRKVEADQFSNRFLVVDDKHREGSGRQKEDGVDNERLHANAGLHDVSQTKPPSRYASASSSHDLCSYLFMILDMPDPYSGVLKNRSGLFPIYREGRGAPTTERVEHTKGGYGK